jgi:hypothetical protein
MRYVLLALFAAFCYTVCNLAVDVKVDSETKRHENAGYTVADRQDMDMLVGYTLAQPKVKPSTGSGTEGDDWLTDLGRKQ